MTKHIILLAAFTAGAAFAQNAQPAPQQAPHAKHMQTLSGAFILGHNLLLEKYDANKDGKLSGEEMKTLAEAGKKDFEAKKADFLKKYDKDGDKKLSKEEWNAVKTERLTEQPTDSKSKEK